MLILAGVTISVLNGAGILTNSQSAADKYEITDEQDVISVAFSTVFANSALNDSDITTEMLQKELDKTTRKTTVTKSTDTGKENYLYITFDKTKNKHFVDITNGHIDYVGPISQITGDWIKDAPIKMEASPTTWTNKNVSVTIEYTIPEDKKIQADKIVLEYALSTAINTWKKYEEPVIIEENMTIYARLNYLGETTEKPASLTITNIDKIEPTIAFTPNGGDTFTMPSVGNATLKAIPTVSDQGGSGVWASSLQYVWSQSTTEPTSGWKSFTNKAQVSKTDISAPGTWYLWTKYNDEARNNTGTEPKVTKSNAFVIGESTKIENEIILSANPTNWTNGDVTVTVKYGANLTKEQTLNCIGNDSERTIYGLEKVVVKVNGKMVTATAKDAMGNMITKSLTVTNIDKTPPTVPTVNLNGYTSGSWTNQNVKITVSSTDIGSGVQKYQYSLDNGGTWKDGGNSTESNDNSYSIIYRAIDKVGNISGNSAPVQINVDKTKPIVTTASATTEAISFTATDTVGVTAYAITTTNTAPSTGWANVNSTTKYTATVNKKIHNSTYYIWVKDAAGNISNSKTVKTGKVPTPTASDLKYTVSWTGTNAKVTFTTTSGFGMQISKDGTTWNQPNPITVATGTTIYVRYSDGTNQGDKYAAVTPILIYNVVYRANGGTGNNITDSNRNYGTTYQTKAANTFSRTGYTFTGWKCNNTNYGAGANYSNLTTTNGATVYMDAQWNVNNYTVTISCNNTSYGTVSNASVSVPYGTTYSTSESTLSFSNGTSVTASATSATGYTTTFSSWSPSSGTITGNTTITANFSRTANTYTLTIDPNGGRLGRWNSDMSTQIRTKSFTYGTAKQFVLVNHYDDAHDKLGMEGNSVPTRSGYDWGCWKITSGGGTIQTWMSSNGTYETYAFLGDYAGDVTVQAQWKDSAAPTVTTASASHYSITFTATDNVGVIAYAITTTNTLPENGWVTITGTTSYTTTVKDKTPNTIYYIWAKDVAGNVSASKSVTTAKLEITNITFPAWIKNGTSSSDSLSFESGERAFIVSESDQASNNSIINKSDEGLTQCGTAFLLCSSAGKEMQGRVYENREADTKYYTAWSRVSGCNVLSFKVQLWSGNEKLYVSSLTKKYATKYHGLGDVDSVTLEAGDYLLIRKGTEYTNKASEIQEKFGGTVKGYYTTSSTGLTVYHMHLTETKTNTIKQADNLWGMTAILKLEFY